MSNKIVYLDNNATTRPSSGVLEIMKENDLLYGNASSMHTLGRNAECGVEWAREQVVLLLNANKDEIYFTSGATESNNTVFNIFRNKIDHKEERNRILLSSVEHPASIETAKFLIELGYNVEYIPVDEEGIVKTNILRGMMARDVALVSVMTGNNESGAIMPIKECASISHSYGAYFHTDATQAIGKIKVDVRESDVDYLSLSGHKFYGPKGIGVLFVKKGSPLSPFMHGGHQEKGYRAGTYNTVSIVGLGEACKEARENLEDENKRLWKMREDLRKGIIDKIPNVIINGPRDKDKCLPGTLNVSFPKAEGESILLYLDAEGIEVSTGSACASGSLEPSYVLLASGLSTELAHGSIRFSFGRYNTDEDVKYTLEKLPGIIERIRKMSTRR